MNSDQRVDLGEPDWSESNMQGSHLRLPFVAFVKPSLLIRCRVCDLSEESLFGTIKTILNEGVKKVELVCSYKEVKKSMDLSGDIGH